MDHWAQSVYHWGTTFIRARDIVDLVMAAVLAAVAFWLWRRYPGFASKSSAAYKNSARHVRVWVLATMLLPVLVRLAFLPWTPPPEPRIHDEFGHLLVADTLASGRLANPPHPLWKYLDTIYVLQHPAYASVYPIGQGTIMAVGEVLFGTPWAGVLLAVSLMCGGITWMLYGCLPPRWAAIGGLLAALEFGFAGAWVDSYWGGAFCAFGGAILFGALCRIRQSPSAGLAAIAGVGWSIVWLTRPFESLIPFLLFWGLIALFVVRESRPRKVWVAPIVIVLSIEAAAGGLTALHNRAVTGSFTTLPYRLTQRIDGVPQTFIWQKPAPPPAPRFRELMDMYWWQRGQRDALDRHPLNHIRKVLRDLWEFFITPWYSLPLLFLLAKRWKEPKVLLALGILGTALAAEMSYPFFYPHYFAGYTCLIAFLITQGLIGLSQWSFRGRPAGAALAAFLLFGGLTMAMRTVPARAIAAGVEEPPTGLRPQVSKYLTKLGGRHVVLVRYVGSHRFSDEWVYNAANVDESPVVWCRAGDESAEEEISKYYTNRQFWVADVDRFSVRMSRYRPGILLTTSTGWSDADSRNWFIPSKESSAR